MVLQLFCVFVALAHALVHMEPDAQVPPGWAMTSTAESASNVSLYFFCSLEQKSLETELLRLSTPGSADFRSWLSRDEVFERFLDSGRVRSVLDFVSKHDGTPKVYGNIIKFDTTVKTVQTMLHTTLGRFTHAESGLTSIKVIDAYHLPESVARHVAFVGGCHQFPSTRQALRAKKNKLLRNQAARGFFTTPKSIRESYGTTNAHNTNSSNSQAVAQFLGQHYRSLDLDEFFLLYSKQDIGLEETF